MLFLSKKFNSNDIGNRLLTNCTGSFNIQISDILAERVETSMAFAAAMCWLFVGHVHLPLFKGAWIAELLFIQLVVGIIWCCFLPDAEFGEGNINGSGPTIMMHNGIVVPAAMIFGFALALYSL